MDDEWGQPSLDIEKASYTVAEIIEWRDLGRLELSPNFQRGNVWSTQAKAYLLDTILRGYPIPPIHIRHVQSARDLVREVIDGQQRLTAVIEFLDGRFPLARPKQASDPLPPWAGKRFADLEEEYVTRILRYSFRCEVYKGDVVDSVIYEIFSRINMHSVQLSAQELRNGRFFGEFKEASYRLAGEHQELWRQLGLFTNAGMARMLDAQFVSEALIVQIEGMQDKKTSIDGFYRRLDQEWEDRRIHEDMFRETIDFVRWSYGDLIKSTRLRRVPLFYSLYSVVFHYVHGIPAQTVPAGAMPLPNSPQRPLDEAAAGRLQTALVELAAALEGDDTQGSDDEDTDEEPSDEAAEAPAAVTAFLAGASGQTDNIRPRLERFHAIWQLAAL